MGTVVFPDAKLKIFLTASVSERAQRRYKQQIDKGIDANLPDLLAELKERDRRDIERPISPLKPAKDAVILDSTELTIDQVTEQILSEFSAKTGTQHYPVKMVPVRITSTSELGVFLNNPAVTGLRKAAT